MALLIRVDPSLAAPGFWFGGTLYGVGLVVGPGGGAPRTPENFENFKKKFLKKIAKNGLF